MFAISKTHSRLLQGPRAEPGIPSGNDLLRSGKIVEHEAAETDDFDSEEVVRPKLLPAPVVPSKQEIAEHRVSHIPPRHWCADCNAGKMIAAQHTERPDTDERSIPVIAM